MVAMSGGVDSTTCAMLLKEQGYAVTGLFMDLGGDDSGDQALRLRALGQKIGITVEVVDLAVPFRKQVKEYFKRSYQAGLTPNPCVVCNREIKFGRLLDHARAGGAEYLATGHYVRIDHDHDRVRLRKGADPGKDQSYFLCRLSVDLLRRCLFPLGGFRKEEVYRMAAARGLEFPGSAESQDVCFLSGRTLADYLTAAGLAPRPGDIVAADGRVLGRHRGTHLYTIGQRRGLGVAAARPLYVIAVDPGRNQVIVGADRDLWRDNCRLGPINWISGPAPGEEIEIAAKIRYRHQPVPARLFCDRDGGRLLFAASQRAVTPGQFAAFYHGDELLGGAEIIG